MSFQRNPEQDDEKGKIPFDKLPEQIQKHAQDTRGLDAARWNKLSAAKQSARMKKFANEMTADYKSRKTNIKSQLPSSSSSSSKLPDASSQSAPLSTNAVDDHNDDQSAASLSLRSNLTEENETEVSDNKKSRSYFSTTRSSIADPIREKRWSEEVAMFGEGYSDADVLPRIDLLQRLQAAGLQQDMDKASVHWLTLTQIELINEICQLVENKADDEIKEDDEIKLLLRKAASSAYFDVKRDLSQRDAIPNYGRFIIQLLAHQNQTNLVSYFVEEYQKFIKEVSQKQKEQLQEDEKKDDLPAIFKATHPERNIYSRAAKYVGAIGNIALTDYFLSKGASLRAAANAAIKHHHKDLIQHLLQIENGLSIDNAIRAAAKFTFQRIIYLDTDGSEANSKKIIEERERSLNILRFLLAEPAATIQVATNEIAKCIVTFSWSGSIFGGDSAHFPETLFILKAMKEFAPAAYLDEILAQASKDGFYVRHVVALVQFGERHHLNLDQLEILCELRIGRSGNDYRLTDGNANILAVYPEKAKYILQLFFSLLPNFSHADEAHANKIKSLAIETCQKYDEDTCRKLVDAIHENTNHFKRHPWMNLDFIKVLLAMHPNQISEIFALYNQFVNDSDVYLTKVEILNRLLKSDRHRISEYVSEVERRFDEIDKLVGYPSVRAQTENVRRQYLNNACKYAEEAILKEQQGLVTSQLFDPIFNPSKGVITLMLEYVGTTAEQKKRAENEIQAKQDAEAKQDTEVQQDTEARKRKIRQISIRNILFSNTGGGASQSTDFAPIATLEKFSSLLQRMQVSNSIANETKEIIPALRAELNNLEGMFRSKVGELASLLEAKISEIKDKVAAQQEQKKSSSKDEVSGTTKILATFMSELENLHQICLSSQATSTRRAGKR